MKGRRFQGGAKPPWNVRLDAASFQDVCFRNRQELALFIADEAHHITQSPNGIYVVDTFVREGGKHPAAIGLGSHDAEEDFDWVGMAELAT